MQVCAWERVGNANYKGTKMIEISKNIIKLDGYGVYVTMIDGEVYTSDTDATGSYPTLDPDGGISWDKLEDPPNQQFLEIVNDKWETELNMTDYDKPMSVGQIRWFVKNLREKHK